MTEKRFTINKSRLVANGFVIDDKEKQYTFSTVEYHKEFLNSFCKALNELHEENQFLKEFIEQLQEELVLFKEAGAKMGIDLNVQITALKQENEQIKQQNLRLHEDLEYYKIKSGSCEEGLFQQDREIAKLKKENMELKLIVEQCQRGI